MLVCFRLHFRAGLNGENRIYRKESVVGVVKEPAFNTFYFPHENYVNVAGKTRLKKKQFAAKTTGPTLKYFMKGGVSPARLYLRKWKFSVEIYF